MATLLIVDDDAATRESLAEALELNGFFCVVAADGDEGLEIARRERPAAAIVDLRMPGMSGTEFISRVHASPGLEALCAILVTAWPTLPDDLDPAVVVLEKPFSVRQLLKVLARGGVSASGVRDAAEADSGPPA